MFTSNNGDFGNDPRLNFGLYLGPGYLRTAPAILTEKSVSGSF
jgi:hypothetical protein